MKSSVYAAAISLAVAIGVIEVQASPYWSSKNDNYDCVGNSGRGDCQESCHRLMRFGIYNATLEQLCTGNDADMLWKWQNCYRCSCKDGSYLMADGKTCSTDNIGCEGNNGLGECHHSCLNLSKLWGSYNASIQQLCTDNDATTSWKQKNCYRCSCKDGFYLMADGKTCKETTCENGYFRCSSDGYCISSDSKCDGEYDCQDKTDEIGCPNAIQNCTEKCQNGGYCNAELECVCESQWEGEYCHLTVCKPACQNNGICNAARTCDCASGWEGAHCHLKVPDCNPKCQNGGTCNTDLECECAPGWEGESCHTFETTCENGYFRCSSDGYCILSDSKCDGEYDCQDKTDEIGCPNAIQNCTEKCQNGGYCNAELECVCESQWEGEDCHLTVCNPACKNNGICNAARTCDCASGWEGAHCHLKSLIIPDCNPKCHNGGTCNADSECDCAPGWEGDTCNYDCNPKCQNGGTCNADSECDCAPGWEGDTCNSETTCDEGDFRCPSNGYCILKTWLCDGEIDCLDDGADERDCPATCASLKCSPNGRCTEKEGRNEAFCTCDYGYVSEEKECIATCTALQCSPNGRCTEKRGITAAFCTCNDGYVIERKGCTECPDGEIIADQCLKFYYERVSWKDAQKRCETQTERLANLDDSEAFKKHMVDKSNSIESNGSEGSTVKRFWVAASESSDNKGEWNWVDGRPLDDDFPWGSHQRKKKVNREYCLAWVSNKLVFDDKNCNDKIGFICEPK